MNTASLCEKKEICGSCSWSDIPYEQQLKDKLDNINSEASVRGLNYECSQIEHTAKTDHYRNKMDFVINYRGEFGLHEKGKWWKVIDNHTCFLPDKKIIELYKKIYSWVKSCGLSYYDRKAITGILRYVIIRASTIGETMVIVLTSEPQSTDEENKIKNAINELGAKLNVTSLIWSYTKSRSDISFGEKTEILQGKPFIEEIINGYKYLIRPNSFFQTNSNGAEILQTAVLNLVKKCNLPEYSNVLDLYCGSGFFTLPLSQLFINTCGVESVQDAVDDAVDNARLNNLKTKFRCDLAEKINIRDYSPDLVLLDPPRAGLHKRVIEDLLDNKPNYLLYVSCKYQKFFEEFVHFKDYYNIVDTKAIDMFPHTPHVELVTLLKRNNYVPAD